MVRSEESSTQQRTRFDGMLKTDLIMCPYCYGDGAINVFISDHHPDCKGDCHNCPIAVPMQEECALCGGDGELTIEELIRSKYFDNFNLLTYLSKMK